MRQASGGSGGKAKRRWTDANEDIRTNPADESAAYPKRQRVSRACDSCRSKKDKCDGAQPVCSTCASLCRPCTYKTNPKKRGLPTGYIRTLELLYGIIFTKIQGSEEVVRTLLKAANIPSHLASMGKEAEGSDTLLASWKNSIVLREIESLLILLEQPEEEQNKGRAPGNSPPDPEANSTISSDTLEWQIPDVLVDRESSLPAIPSPVKTPTNTSAVKAPTQRTTTKDSGVQAWLPVNEMNYSLPDRSSQRAVDPPATVHHNKDHHHRLPSNAWSLLDIYFTYTQCWLPILEKHDILRTAFRYAEEDIQISPTSSGSGGHAALWAALTLASFQEVSIAATRQLTDLPKDPPDPHNLYTTAKSLVPSEEGEYEIGHVQALLILSLIKLGQQDWTAAWMLVGQAVRIAQYLGLNHKSNDSGRSKHVFLGCFVLETLVAAQMHQIPSLQKEDLSVIGPINEDGLEEWHPWEDQTGLRPSKPLSGSFHRGPLHALSTFNRLVSLVSILNELCCLRHRSTASVSQLEAVERQLQLWVSALPKAYRVDLQSNPTRSAPHVFGLEILYEGVVTVLGLEIASQESNGTMTETPRKRRAIESSKRLLLLLQTYMETYSLSATCPTFGMILTLGIQRPDGGQRVSSSAELEFGLQNKLQSFSSHVASVWSVSEKTAGESSTDEVQTTVTSTSIPANQQGSFANISPSETSVLPNDIMTQGPSRFQATALDPRSEAPRIDMIDDPRAGLNINSFLSNPWMRTPASLDDSTSLLRTPTPSLTNARTAAETSRQPSQLNGPTPSRTRHSISTTKPIREASLLSDLPVPFQPATSQCPPTYNDPNLNLDSFVDMDGYGQPRRQRIAPDLDALFDELASLDGTEKADNQPEFMQNLGFVPDAGMPELYPYSDQTEPFLLAQTQQKSGPETSTGRRES